MIAENPEIAEMDARAIDASPAERVEHLLTVIACALTKQPRETVAWWSSSAWRIGR